jgi:dTDP-4-amino-4,6-dideoxygalactose transaminase
MDRIDVTKTFLPPTEEYEQYLKGIWSRGQLTNNGPLLNDFETRVKTYLGVEDFHFVTNGTLALQLALNALNIKSGEIITTPFSYVATTSAILWERCRPVYVDIDPKTLCIDVNKIEDAITPFTKAILAVHVFGRPCGVEKIETIAKKHGLKVIYDGAHAFGVRHGDRSLLSYGDVSTCSFHATKLFHTIEGGCVISSSSEISSNLELSKRFGHDMDDHFQLGINAKASEFQAAMGLCNLNYVDSNIAKRKKVSDLYDKLLEEKYGTQFIPKDTIYNYAYYPIQFESEKALQAGFKALQAQNIHPRRYFYPSLNTLPYIDNLERCPIAEDITRRIACLPLYPDLEEGVVRKICEIITA